MSVYHTESRVECTTYVLGSEKRVQLEVKDEPAEKIPGFFQVQMNSRSEVCLGCWLWEDGEHGPPLDCQKAGGVEVKLHQK